MVVPELKFDFKVYERKALDAFYAHAQMVKHAPIKVEPPEQCSATDGQQSNESYVTNYMGMPNTNPYSEKVDKPQQQDNLYV